MASVLDQIKLAGDAAAGEYVEKTAHFLDAKQYLGLDHEIAKEAFLPAAMWRGAKALMPSAGKAGGALRAAAPTIAGAGVGGVGAGYASDWNPTAMAVGAGVGGLAGGVGGSYFRGSKAVANMYGAKTVGAAEKAGAGTSGLGKWLTRGKSEKLMASGADDAASVKRLAAGLKANKWHGTTTGAHVNKNTGYQAAKAVGKPAEAAATTPGPGVGGWFSKQLDDVTSGFGKWRAPGSTAAQKSEGFKQMAGGALKGGVAPAVGTSLAYDYAKPSGGLNVNLR